MMINDAHIVRYFDINSKYSTVQNYPNNTLNVRNVVEVFSYGQIDGQNWPTLNSFQLLVNGNNHYRFLYEMKQITRQIKINSGN